MSLLPMPAGCRLSVCGMSAHARGKKNCGANPLCVWGLGEAGKQGVVWAPPSALAGVLEDALGLDPAMKKRLDELPGGLMNLGATCYLGSLLQFLYTSPAVRRSVYGGEGEVSGTLEKVFADVELGRRRSCSVAVLTELLGLDPSEQQDPQEFGKLLAHKLEDERPGAVWPLMRGKMRHATTCHHCGASSTQIVALDEVECVVTSGDSVAACVEALQEPETLEGDNSYYCQLCKAKRRAERRSVVVEAPQEVLLVQLLRYVYDKSTGEKRKLKKSIELSESLDLCGTKFSLCAVVFHRGEEASVGHYVVHALRDGTWFEFDDDNVRQVAPPYAPRKQRKKPEKGEAYMLLYARRRRTEESPTSSSTSKTPSPTALAYVARLDDAFQAECAAYDARRVSLLAAAAARRSTHEALFASSPAPECADDGLPCGQYCLLEVSVLRAWVRGDDLLDPTAAEARPEAALLCLHGRVRPEMLKDLKCLSVPAYEKIVGDLPALGRRKLTQTDALCHACLQANLAASTAAKQLDLERASLCDELRAAAKSETKSGAFLVAKAWYQQLCRPKRRKPVDDSATADLWCAHGELDPSKATVSVDRDAWLRLTALYPSSKPILATTPVCVQCARSLDVERRIEDDRRRELRENPALKGLLDRLSSTDDDSGPPDISEGRLVRRLWLSTWKAYHLSSRPKPPALGDQSSRCDHGRARLPPWVACRLRGDQDPGLRIFALQRATDSARALDDLVLAGDSADMDNSVDVVSEEEFEALAREYGPVSAPSLEDGWCDVCLTTDSKILDEARTKFEAHEVHFTRSDETLKRRRRARPAAVRADSTDPLGLVLLRLLERWDLPSDVGVVQVYDAHDKPLGDDLRASLEDLGVKAASSLRADVGRDATWTFEVLAAHFTPRVSSNGADNNNRHRRHTERGFQGTLLVGAAPNQRHHAPENDANGVVSDDDHDRLRGMEPPTVAVIEPRRIKSRT